MTQPKQALTFFGTAYKATDHEDIFKCGPMASMHRCRDGTWDGGFHFDVYVGLPTDPHLVARAIEHVAIKVASSIIRRAGGWVEGVDEEYTR